MNEQNKPKPRQNFAYDILYFVATKFAVLLIRDFLVGTSHVREIPYSEFRQSERHPLAQQADIDHALN